MHNLYLILISLFFTLFFCVSSYSQQWINTFDGNSHGDDQILASITDINGNIYVTGYATRTSTGKDICTIKYNSSGELEWVVYYDGPAHSDDRAFGIVADRLGQNIYVTGYSTGTGSGTDFTTIKYSSGGSQLFVNRFGDPSNEDDRAFGIAIDRVNNVYITGYITRSGIGQDIYTVKYNQNLVFIWQRVFNGSGNSEDKAFGIITDSLGLKVYITGYTTDDENGTDMITINYDSSGATRWSKIYNGSENGDDRAFGIAGDKYQGGGIYITGFSTNNITGADFTTIKYNAETGSVNWTAKYSGGEIQEDKAFGIAIDQFGNSYVTGTSDGGETSMDYLTIKYNSGGDSLWTARYNGAGNRDDSPASLVLSNSFEYLYVTGSAANDNLTGNDDIVTIKYDTENGNEIQQSRISTNGNMPDIAVKVLTDTSNNIFVAGYTKTVSNGYDFLTMKYQNGDLVIGIQVISNEIPSGFELYQNYPNPFNPTTKIRFDIPPLEGGRGRILKLVIYDILGREAATLVNEQLKPGTYEVDWDGSSFASGIYFYKLVSQDFSQTQKMVLVK